MLVRLFFMVFIFPALELKFLLLSPLYTQELGPSWYIHDQNFGVVRVEILPRSETLCGPHFFTLARRIGKNMVLSST